MTNLSLFIASHPWERPRHSQCLLPRDSLVRDSVRDRAEQDEERRLRVRRGRAQVRNKIIKISDFVVNWWYFRFYHAGDECLTIPSTWSMDSPETKYLDFPQKNNCCFFIFFKKNLFPQHPRVRGRRRPYPGPLPLEAGAGQDQVVWGIHQLVPPHEDKAHHHRALPGGQREQRAMSPQQVKSLFRFSRKSEVVFSFSLESFCCCGKTGHFSF